MKHITDYNKDTHTAHYTIWSRGKKFTGTATCAEADYDFESQRVGTDIAAIRAYIAELQDLKRIKVAQREALFHILDIYRQDESINDRSKEYILLARQVRWFDRDIQETNDMIIQLRNELKYIIEAKDKIYKLLREKRKNDN